MGISATLWALWLRKDFTFFIVITVVVTNVTDVKCWDLQLTDELNRMVLM